MTQYIIWCVIDGKPAIGQQYARNCMEAMEKIIQRLNKVGDEHFQRSIWTFDPAHDADMILLGQKVAEHLKGQFGLFIWYIP